MKIKIFVGIALVIFILAVGSILASGLMQKNFKLIGNVIQTSDMSAIVDTKKNTQQSITSVANNSTSVNSAAVIDNNTQNTQSVITQPTHPVVKQPVRKVITRAS